MIDYEKLLPHATAHPYPLVFASLSGAHLYGFPSADSDFDLRGVHVLSAKTMLGLDAGQETLDKDGVYDGLEIDLVTHDAKKFFLLMLRANGYVLEQVLSPLVVHSTPEHEELQEIAAGCITRHHAKHYLGFAASQMRLFAKDSPPRVKPLLYTFRVLLTGMHLMRSGRIEANLTALNQDARLGYVDELIAVKTQGAEKETLADADLGFYQAEVARLTAELEEAYRASSLPDQPTARAALNDLLIRLRTAPRCI